MKIGDTGLELGEFVKDETEEYGAEEVEEEQVDPEESGESDPEEDDEIAKEYGEATKEDFIKAIKTYKGRAVKAEERAEFFKDLYNAVPISNPAQQKQFKKAIESEDEDFLDDLAKKSDLVNVVDDALERERAYRRNEMVRSETQRFAKEHPDFAERLAIVDKLATNDRKLQAIIEAHPRPWELVYEIAEKSGEYVPKNATTNKSEILKKIKENAQKPKPLSDTKSKSVVKKPISQMTDDEFEKHYAEVRASE